MTSGQRAVLAYVGLILAVAVSSLFAEQVCQEGLHLLSKSPDIRLHTGAPPPRPVPADSASHVQWQPTVPRQLAFKPPETDTLAAKAVSLNPKLRLPAGEAMQLSAPDLLPLLEGQVRFPCQQHRSHPHACAVHDASCPDMNCKGQPDPLGGPSGGDRRPMVIILHSGQSLTCVAHTQS